MKPTLTPEQESQFSHFMKVCDQFKLGILTTEQPHPLTQNLSQLANNDLPQAITILKKLDIDLFDIALNKLEQIQEMANAIQETFKNGNRLFLCGCGATGRLSLVLETIWRQLNPQSEQVISFMAGGDIALIKSIEDFEDHREFGERQLCELGFHEGDLLIGSSEGGETSFVIGAVEKAAQLSKSRSYFLYCNPDNVLSANIERSRNIIQNEAVGKINLTCGPMALSGSTRMQASTILMLCIGLAMIYPADEIKQNISQTKILLEETSYDFLHSFIEEESKIYQDGGYLFYNADPTTGIGVLTDTTERSPTFNLHPYENIQDANAPAAYSYLLLENAQNVEEAWHYLLARAPRALDWKSHYDRVNLKRLYGHDIGPEIQKHRSHLKNEHFYIKHQENSLLWRLKKIENKIDLKNASLLAINVLLKSLLNIHSTLVMGRMGRYQDNIMIWVRSSNLKLIDRSIRYAQLLLANEKLQFSYEKLARVCFEEMPQVTSNDPIVLRMVRRLKNGN